MKKSIKASLIIIVLALVAGLACLVWFVSRPEEPDKPDEAVAENVLANSGSSSFEVRVIVPRMGRPLGGILPDSLVRKLDGTPSELRFDHTSPGARIASAGNNRVELKADGWDLLIETNGEGRVTSGTYLTFPMPLGGRQVTLSCRPSDRASGYIRAAAREGSGKIDGWLSGSFDIELASCKNAASGKTTDWPPSPLKVRGNFVGPNGRR